MKERDLEKKCRLHAESLGGRLIKIRTPGTKGFPDRLLLTFNGIAFLEFKHPKGTGRLSPAQKRWLEWLKRVNVKAVEIVSFEQFRALLLEHSA